MFVEKNNTSYRGLLNSENSMSFSDIEFLKKFFKEHGNYPLFSQVLLETRTDCNLSCRFCPQSHFNRPLQVMNWGIFEHIINQLYEINFSGRIAFFMTNEPLLDNRLFEMIKYARKKSSRFFLDITTNGKGLTSKIVDELFFAGLDNININDYRNDRKKYPDRISKFLIDIVSNYKNNPKLTYNKRSSKEILSNYAGTIKGEKRKLLSTFCNYPFRKLSISAVGNVILCCNDYKYKTNFGNVMEKSLRKIWFSEELNIYRNDLLNELRSGICSSCDEFQKYSVFT